MAWISRCFNRLIHLLCLFTTFPLRHTHTHTHSRTLSIVLFLPPSLSAHGQLHKQMQFVFLSVRPKGKWMDLAGNWVFSLRSVVVLYYRWEKVKSVSLLQFAQNISHADLCKFLPQSFAFDWLELHAPARQTRSLNPDLHSLTGREKGRWRGTAFVSWRHRWVGHRQAYVGHPRVIRWKHVWVVARALSRCHGFWRANQGWDTENVWNVQL